MTADDLYLFRLELCDKLYTGHVDKSDLPRLLKDAGDPDPDGSAKWVVEQMWEEIAHEKYKAASEIHPEPRESCDGT
jgi:hypothetical protein